MSGIGHLIEIAHGHRAGVAGPGFIHTRTGELHGEGRSIHALGEVSPCAGQRVASLNGESDVVAIEIACEGQLQMIRSVRGGCGQDARAGGAPRRIAVERVFHQVGNAVAVRVGANCW
jgi:hypothetical protein